MTHNQNKVVHGMDMDEYQEHPAVSRSGLMEMMRSPQHYHWRYLSGKAEKEDTTPLRVGAAFHTLVLEPDTFHSRAIVWSGKPRNTKEGKDEYAAAQASANGRVLLKQGEFDDLKDMAAALLAQPASSKVIAKNGKIESSFFWFDDEFKVWAKARPDYYRDDGIVLDLKTCEDASREAFEKSIVNYGYDIQAYMQMEAIKQVTGKAPDNFVFVCVEKDKPHCTAFYVADQAMLECGSVRYARLMSRYAECFHAKNWPGYGNLIQTISVPKWFASKLDKGE